MTDTTEEEVGFLANMRTPEMEMAETGGGVPAAAHLAIEDINPTNPHLFKDDGWHDHFARLRAEAPMRRVTSFIAMDPPEHTEQRKTVRSVSAPSNLRNVEPLIRERTMNVLESLPEGETFDCVDTVSIELTTLMLATLFDFPLADRRKLTRWSDMSAHDRVFGAHRARLFSPRRCGFRCVADHENRPMFESRAGRVGVRRSRRRRQRSLAGPGAR